MDKKLNSRLDTEIFGDYVRVGFLSRENAEILIEEQISCQVPDTHRDKVKIQHHTIPYVGLVYITWALRQQIEGVIPPKARYRRCILFTSEEDAKASAKTISWKYTPNLLIMTEEACKISRFLLSALEREEYAVKKIPCSNATGIEHFLVYKCIDAINQQLATPWMFLTANRAWAWVHTIQKEGE